MAQKLWLWPGLRWLGLCKSLGPAKAPSEGLARAWLGSGRGFWQRNIFVFKMYRTDNKNKSYLGLETYHVSSRAPAATAVSRCYGDGGDGVATWLVCRVSVVPVEVLVMAISIE